MKKEWKAGAIAIVILLIIGIVIFSQGENYPLKKENPVKYEEVITKLHQVKDQLKKDENNIDLLVKEGSYYEALGADDKAIDVYLQALKIESHVSMAYVNLGSIYAKQKKYDKAVDIYKKAIEIYPNDSQYYNNLSDLYANGQGGTKQDAILLLEKGVKNTNDTSLKAKLEKLKQ